jgi:hypothetical protein
MRFQPGNQYIHNGKAGRPKGSRNRVSMRLIEAYEEAFEKWGEKCLEVVAKMEPVKFLQLGYGALIPRQLDIEATAIAALTDEQLDHVLEHIERQQLEQRKLIEHEPGTPAPAIAGREKAQVG